MKAPVVYLGEQMRTDGTHFSLWNLTEWMGCHPPRSTICDETILEAGFELPEKRRSA